MQKQTLKSPQDRAYLGVFNLDPTVRKTGFDLVIYKNHVPYIFILAALSGQRPVGFSDKNVTFLELPEVKTDGSALKTSSHTQFPYPEVDLGSLDTRGNQNLRFQVM